MSLKVFAYRRRTPDAPVEFLDVKPQSPNTEMAGFESMRTTFWGSDALVRRGLEILPRLRDADVFAEGPELDKLERELATVLDDLPAIERETRCDARTVDDRVRNIREAIRLAREVRAGAGGVYIG
jgi:hypothetical protein